MPCDLDQNYYDADKLKGSGNIPSVVVLAFFI